jgi:SAM-dependent methyltransferase
MGVGYQLLKAVHDHLPPRMRGFIWGDRGKIANLVRSSARTLQNWVRDDSVYSAGYYEAHVDGPARQAAPAIAEAVIAEFRPGRVLDIGCGSGAILAEFAARGVDVTGLDNSEAALAFCSKRGLAVQKFDLERELEVKLTGDVALSTEVAEHLPAAVADRYVDFLCKSAPVIVITAATPGQGGTGHVNEQPHEYWIRKFEARGFEHLESVSRNFGEAWAARNVASWYSRNVMAFRRRPAATVS